jgi:hypothetical protein
MAGLLKEYGNRVDGTKKGTGYLGELKRPDGSVSTEISVGVDFGAGETEIPLLVPTLDKEEINYLLNNKPDPSTVPKTIMDKAVKHAIERLKAGKSPFDTGGQE